MWYLEAIDKCSSNILLSSSAGNVIITYFKSAIGENKFTIEKVIYFFTVILIPLSNESWIEMRYKKPY